MKKLVIIILVVAFASALVACNQDPVYQTIRAEDAYEAVAKETVLLLDVRTEAEYLEGTIQGSVLYPLDTIDESIIEVYPDFSQTIYVFCRSGNRSETAANKLLELGYTDVYDLGGIIDWPYEIY